MDDPYIERRAAFYRSVLPKVPLEDIICAYRSKNASGDYCYIVIKRVIGNHHWRACNWQEYASFMLED